MLRASKTTIFEVVLTPPTYLNELDRAREILLAQVPNGTPIEVRTDSVNKSATITAKVGPVRIDERPDLPPPPAPTDLRDTIAAEAMKALG